MPGNLNLSFHFNIAGVMWIACAVLTSAHDSCSFATLKFPSWLLLTLFHHPWRPTFSSGHARISGVNMYQ